MSPARTAALPLLLAAWPVCAASASDRAPTDADRAAAAEAFAAGDVDDPELPGRAAAFAADRSRVAARGAEPGARFDQHADILRFPELWGGEPVRVSGGRLGPVTGGGEIHFTTVAASDGRYAVAVRGGDLPEPGAWVTVTGVVAGVSRGGDGPAVPLIAAASVDRAGAPISPARWAAVRHRTLGIRPAERPLYYDLLAAAAETPLDEQRAAAERFAGVRRVDLQLPPDAELPTFADVFRHPRHYEAERVTLTGYARRVVDYPAGENPHGLTTLTEASVFTEDSQSNPAVVVAASADADLPRGDDLMVPVRFTGYFFKMYGFEARDANRVAPLFLAGRLERLAEPAPAAGGPWLLVLAAVVAVAGLSAGWWAWRLRPKRRRLPGAAGTVDAAEFPPERIDADEPPLFHEPPR